MREHETLGEVKNMTRKDGEAGNEVTLGSSPANWAGDTYFPHASPDCHNPFTAHEVSAFADGLWEPAG